MPATTLELSEIIQTADRLAARVHARFAGRGIASLVDELAAISRETEGRVRRLREPRRRLRVGLVTLAVASIALVVFSATRIGYGFHIDGTEEWLDVLANAIQDLVFIGIAVVFLLGVEGRLKRRDALAGLHDLRSLAHVIDMHQLTKDPDSALHPSQRSPASPDRPDDLFALGRYLDYCSEMLSITSKLAALYAQESQDPVVLSAVGGIQDLTGALSNKVWQKLVILDTGA